MDGETTSRNIAVAAEALAAAQFARCGFDVSVQYGANQPEYDLIVARRTDGKEQLLKVSVKGSQDGSWGLTQSFLKKAVAREKKAAAAEKKPDYHGAIDRWLSKHGALTAFCFVQFKGVSLTELPRLYLATTKEVAQRLKDTAKGRGDTILYENHSWGAKAVGAGTVERLPESWRFTSARVDQMLSAAVPAGVV